MHRYSFIVVVVVIVVETLENDGFLPPALRQVSVQLSLLFDHDHRSADNDHNIYLPAYIAVPKYLTE